MMKRLLTLTLTAVCLVTILTACEKQDTDGQAENNEQTISGIVNQLGDYLVLLDDQEEYQIFDFGEQVDPSTLEEGDKVTVTYTGTLGSEDPAPVATAIEKVS